MTERPISVGRLTKQIGDKLAGLGPLLVKGELSAPKVSSAGHFYATLKDANATISVVMWRSTMARHGPMPKEGAAVVVRGSLDVYGPRGSYQLIARRVEAQGQGDLAARFEAIKAQLQAEGLFDDNRKQDLPYLPRGLGIATAAGSAALADMLHGVQARFPSMPVFHAPCQVQGPGAAATIVAALQRLDAHPQVELIVLGRGGGSLEDLWAFNEEPVVRAIAACSTPVISAVGHESDTTLADLVADLRAKTPTAAIEEGLPEEAELRKQLSNAVADLHELITERLTRERKRLGALATHRALATPAFQIRLRRQRLGEHSRELQHLGQSRLDTARQRLQGLERYLALLDPRSRLAPHRRRLEERAVELAKAMQRRLGAAQQRLGAQAGRLDAYSPLGVIARGYSVVRDLNGEVVRHLNQAPAGTPIRARVEDGWLHATVDGNERRRLAEASDIYEV
ncbi:MAG: exodeoxyribonuclease VII large subunit [Planctomycetota bacterium]|jgi:exodeoxyribonuclease VII large subunit|nr:exodeoxyribonuclease VII large subunit [Planctomycetota bacterium]